jgi:chromosomal replication initiator protein
MSIKLTLARFFSGVYNRSPAPSSGLDSSEMQDLFTLGQGDELNRLEKAWEHVLRRLSADIPSAWFERFIRPLSPIGVKGGIVTIAVPGKFVMEWVRDRYVATIQQCLSDEFGEPLVVELRTEPREKSTIPGSPPSGVSLPTTASTDSGFRPLEKFSFESYVVGQSNRLAVAGARAVAQEPGTKYNPLFIYGSSGLGKTHLLHAIAREILKKDPKYPLAFVSAQQFAEDFVNALQTNRIDHFRRLQRSVCLWLVDDVQFVAGKDRTQEELFHTFNMLQSTGKQIVLTSDRPPRDLYLMDERLRSRFEAGLVADVQMPDTETRCAILLSKANQENLDLDVSTAMYLAENVPGNIRILEGALTKLAANASLDGRGLSMELATMMVEQYYRSGMLAKPGFGSIVDAVSRHYKIPSDDIKGTSRKAPIVHARHIAVYITREITGDSWKHIGGLFGDRDHTSMMHGYTKISELMNADKDLKATVKMLIRNLYPEA